jgi:long-chain fatty acid transport protein
MRNYFSTILILTSFLFPINAFAGGFLILNQYAEAGALGLAYTARVNNPSAVLYNPAAINQLEGMQCSMNSTFITYRSEFHSYQTGKTTAQDDHLFILPSFYLTKKINDQWSVGIGSFSHFGLTSDWPSDWEGRYLATFAQLRSFFVNPVVSYQMTPKLSIAAGINGIYSDVLQRKNINLMPLPDGRARFKGNDLGWGYNLALLYRITDKLKFGLSYRSQIDMHYEGDIKFHVPRFIKDLVPEGGASLDIDLPSFLSAGFCYTVLEKWIFEFDVIWTGWSSYDKLALKFDKPVPKIMEKSAAPIIRDYKNVYDFCLGVSYQATPCLTLRAGYLFDPSPVPEENVDPILPDSDKNIYTIGMGYKRGSMTVDLANYLVFYRGIDVRRNRDGLNGKYETFVNMIGVSISFAL